MYMIHIGTFHMYNYLENSGGGTVFVAAGVAHVLPAVRAIIPLHLCFNNFKSITLKLDFCVRRSFCSDISASVDTVVWLRRVASSHIHEYWLQWHPHLWKLPLLRGWLSSLPICCAGLKTSEVNRWGRKGGGYSTSIIDVAINLSYMFGIIPICISFF